MTRKPLDLEIKDQAGCNQAKQTIAEEKRKAGRVHVEKLGQQS